MRFFFQSHKHSPSRVGILVGIFCVSLIAGYLGGLMGSSEGSPDPVRPPIVIEDRTRQQTTRTESPSRVLHAAVRPSIVSLYRVTARELEKPWTDRALTQSDYLGAGIALTADGWIATTLLIDEKSIGTLLAVDSDHNAYRIEKNAFDPSSATHFLKVNSARLQAVQMASENIPGPQEAYLVSDISAGREDISILSYPLPKEADSAIQSTERLAKRFNPTQVYLVSGLPVVSLSQEVLGITARNGIVPIHYLSRSLRSVLKSGVVLRPKANLSYFDNEHLPLIPTPPNQARSRTGATVVSQKTTITVPTPTGTARLLSGDVITNVNADAVNGQRSLSELLNEYQPGDSVQLKVRRGEGSITISLLLQ